jgi:hypothetical protein
MTYALMLWTIIACDAYSCKSDWRQVMEFDYNREAKALCEEAGKALFADRKYQCLRTK